MGGAPLGVRARCTTDGIGGGEVEYMGFMGIAFPPTIMVLEEAGIAKAFAEGAGWAFAGILEGGVAGGLGAGAAGIEGAVVFPA